MLFVGLLLAVAVCMSRSVAFDESSPVKTSGSGLRRKGAAIYEMRGVDSEEMRDGTEKNLAVSNVDPVENFELDLTSTSTPNEDEIKELKGEKENAYLNKDLEWTLKFKDEIVLKGKLNWNNSLKAKPVDCSKWSNADACYEWPKEARFTISLNRSQTLDMDCFDLEWTALRCVDQVFTDCFEIGSAHWYGGYQNKQQYWPLSRNGLSMTAFISNDIFWGSVGDVLERYFFSSKGTGIHIDSDVPFYYSMDDPKGQMCLSAKYETVGYNNFDHRYPALKYKICQSDSVKSIHSKMSAMFLPKPTDIPDKKLFQFPIWSTWAEFRKDVNQSGIIKFARDILANNFTHAQLEIDDNWTPAYGDYEFDVQKLKFPTAAEMIRMLNHMGFRVTAWVHPFFNINSKSFIEGASNAYFIRAYNSTQPALIKWWDGNLSAILDPTNPNASLWYLNKLENLKKVYNISSFKFDAGEAGFLPPVFSSFQQKRDPNEIYPKSYVEMVMKSDKSRHLEVRAGYHTQQHPVFVRIMDKYSEWGHENGIQSVIPVALTFGLLGYPFILPDMIAGNLKSMNDSELYVRWIELNTFLPSMQFSLVPWKFGDAVVKIAQYYTKLHEKYSPLLIKLAEESTMTGHPIIRPIWWIDPDSEDALTCEDEFLVGDVILVAPVVEQGARARDIYLPPGEWLDELRNEKHQGPLRLRGYTVELNELAYFSRAS